MRYELPAVAVNGAAAGATRRDMSRPAFSDSEIHLVGRRLLCPVSQTDEGRGDDALQAGTGLVELARCKDANSDHDMQRATCDQTCASFLLPHYVTHVLPAHSRARLT